MFCEICGKNEATIHIQEIINSKKKILNICKACAESKKASKEMLSGLDLAQLMYNISTETDAANATSKGPKIKTFINPPVKCPSCGWDIVRFTTAGRLGCAECFKTFRTILDQAIRNMHKGSMHVGKKPGLDNNKPSETQDKLARLMELQKKLEEYVMREEYEKAAKTRDIINELKGGIKTKTKEKDRK